MEVSRLQIINAEKPILHLAGFEPELCSIEALHQLPLYKNFNILTIPLTFSSFPSTRCTRSMW